MCLTIIPCHHIHDMQSVEVCGAQCPETAAPREPAYGLQEGRAGCVQAQGPP